MSLLGGITRRGRALAEARMLDSCTIAPEKVTVDKVTLQTTTTGAAQYTGKCRLRSVSDAVSDREAAGQSFSDQALILSIPVGSAGAVRPNSIVTITAVDPESGDPALVGRRFRIAGEAAGSQATASRFAVVSV
jgi:hypothetical protein